MPIYTNSEFKQNTEDFKGVSESSPAKYTYAWIDPNIQEKSLIPKMVIVSDSGESLLVEYNEKANTFNITQATSEHSYKNLLEKAKSNIANKKALEFVTNMIESAKGSFIDTSVNIDSMSEKEIFQIIGSVEKKTGESALETLMRIPRELASYVAKTTTQVPKKAVKEIVGAIPESKYKDFIRERNLKINKELDKFWRGIDFDKKNPIQKEIAERFGERQSVMLIGDPGIGKTYNPENMAKANGIEFSTLKLHSGSDSAEILGKQLFRSSVYTGQQEMYFDEGSMTKAFRQANEEIKKGKGFVLVLDEILRCDPTPFISNLSIHDNSEYALLIDKTNDFVKMETDRGELWFHVSDEINRDLQKYEIKNSKIVVDKDTDPLLYFAGSPEQASERHCRGDLLSLHKEDFREILKTSKRDIIATYSDKERIYCPSNAISIVATANPEENFDINMAFLSRLNPIPTEAPSISYMVKKCVEKAKETKSWTPAEEKSIEGILTTFATTVSKALKSTKSIENPQKMNFRIINSLIDGIAPELPFAETPWSVENVLKRSVVKFTSIDSATSISALKSNPIVSAVERCVVQSMELSKNPAAKPISEEMEEQEAPSMPSAKEEEEEGSRIGMKI